ncbi:peptidase C15 [Methylobacterium sp. J-090]|uniref:pyroglutamyl-peptidase I family protein n=1 Tax=Methylobacterium sp. J-090 TaxID=2836666 RepID=UPI001FBA228E|nr:peptidase C15 [Methylobacterium sp. J-090]MCJ2083964.1 peptidase C15 [Methylobacterium sp. J-090]
MSGKHLLVTGFGPFPGVPVNPSAVVARRLAALARRHGLAGGDIRLLILPTAYGAIETHLVPALAAAPDAVLMLGVARSATRVRVEFRARNRASRLFPDASGHVARRLTLAADGPAERRATAAAPALATLRRNGIPAIASNDAGRYLCNAAYFRGLAEAAPVLFVHIPPLPRAGRPGPFRRGRSPVEALAAALVAVARGLLGRPGVHRAATTPDENSIVAVPNPISGVL